MGCADVDFPAILSNAEHRLPSVYKCSQAIKVNQSNRHAAWDTCHNHHAHTVQYTTTCALYCTTVCVWHMLCCLLVTRLLQTPILQTRVKIKTSTTTEMFHSQATGRQHSTHTHCGAVQCAAHVLVVLHRMRIDDYDRCTMLHIEYCDSL